MYVVANLKRQNLIRLPMDAYLKAREMIPDAAVHVTARRVVVVFKTTKQLNAFIDGLTEIDEDMPAQIEKWFTSLTAETLDDGKLRLRPTIYLDKEQLRRVLRCLELAAAETS